MSDHKNHMNQVHEENVLKNEIENFPEKCHL